MKLTNRTLSAKARDAILNIIDEGSDFMEKLPSEQELSLRLGVSRNTIREALKALENEGIVAPRHGVGTFIIRDSKNIKSNIAILDSFTKIITSHGYKSGSELLNYDTRKADKFIASKLSTNLDANILYIERVRTADDLAVIYVEDYLYDTDGMYEKFHNNKTESLFDFFMSFGIKISFSNCNISAIISDENIQQKLSLNKEEALLHLQQTHYTSKGIPVMYSDSYFLSNKFDFSLIRKTID